LANFVSATPTVKPTAPHGVPDGRKVFISGALVDEDDILLAEAHALTARLLPGQP
jgi:hypothetical protein